MAKICNHSECSNPVFGKGYCKYHQYLRTDKKKPKPIKKISDKQSKINAAYSVLRQQFLKNNPKCERCGDDATEIHHKEGRGIRTLDDSTFMSSCRKCHVWIHANPEEARKLGYLI